MQYVGKLMRSVDASAIEQALAVDEERHQGAVKLLAMLRIPPGEETGRSRAYAFFVCCKYNE